jgi:MFS family permease
VLALTFFFCCAAHSGPIFHMVSYAISCGVPAMAAVTVYSVEGLAGLGGRLLFGVLADRLGVKKVLIAGLAVQAVAIASYLLVNRLAEFYALAVVFGAAYGGVMPLYAVLAREYFGQHIMGPVVGGWIFDSFDAYSWLFLGSAAVGLGAVAVALAFPPLRARQAQAWQPA